MSLTTEHIFSTNEINCSVVIVILFHSLSALESWFLHLHTCVGKSLQLEKALDVPMIVDYIVESVVKAMQILIL